MNKTPISIYLNSGYTLSIQMDSTEKEFLEEIENGCFSYVKFIVDGNDLFIMKNAISAFDFMQTSSLKKGFLIKSP